MKTSETNLSNCLTFEICAMYRSSTIIKKIQLSFFGSLSSMSFIVVCRQFGHKGNLIKVCLWYFMIEYDLNSAESRTESKGTSEAWKYLRLNWKLRKKDFFVKTIWLFNFLFITYDLLDLVNFGIRIRNLMMDLAFHNL